MTLMLPPLGWFGIARLGLVQMALGAIVVLTTSTLNRVMVVELALPAMLPGALVALHYAVQISRPRMGHGSDMGGRRTPWIIGGMAVLAAGGVLAALATAWMATAPLSGTLLALLAFLLIGAGVGASGTSLLVLMAARVAPERRAPAATITWVLMIIGFIITAGVAGSLLDPFSTTRLVMVTAGVATAALLLACLAVRGIEGAPGTSPASPAAPRPATVPFTQAIRQVWAEREARGFAVFVFVSMLAYSAQDLILEPYAGTVFGLTPGESTRLSGLQHGGVLAGMVLVALVGAGRRSRHLRVFTVGGCLASALALAVIGLGGLRPEGFPLKPAVFALGLANGAYAVAAIGSMMERVARGRERREGVRMGLWGAAQAIAFGIGGFLGTASVDIARSLIAGAGTAYATVFLGQSLLFIASAWLALRLVPGAASARTGAADPTPDRSALSGTVRA